MKIGILILFTTLGSFLWAEDEKVAPLPVTTPSDDGADPDKTPPESPTDTPSSVSTNTLIEDALNPDGMTHIPAGTFTMGITARLWRDNEAPKRKVYVQSYYIDTHEVTNIDYKQCVLASKCREPKYYYNSNYNKDDYPVVGVSWEDARDYCKWAGKRLPTEAEWEKAARGTDERKYCWGNKFSLYGKRKYANVYGDYDGYLRTAPVDKFKEGKSPYGVLNMCGNAAEWVNDYYGEDYYAQKEVDNPKGPSKGTYRVIRGGSWNDSPPHFQTTFREKANPTSRAKTVGFRCAVSLK